MSPETAQAEDFTDPFEDEGEIAPSCDLENPETCESCQ